MDVWVVITWVAFQHSSVYGVFRSKEGAREALEEIAEESGGIGGDVRIEETTWHNDDVLILIDDPHDPIPGAVAVHRSVER